MNRLTGLFTKGTLTNRQLLSLNKIGIDIEQCHKPLDSESLIKKLKGKEIYIIGGEDKASSKVIENTDLRLIIFYGTGFETYIDLKSARGHNILIANTPGANSHSVSEYTCGLILQGAKDYIRTSSSILKGRWEMKENFDLKNKTLGIIGAGSIGQNVAGIMHNGFKMKIIYYSRTSKPNLESKHNARQVSLRNVLSQSDVVSVNATLNSATKHLIDSEKIFQMKDNVTIVNTARADIIEPNSLRRFLIARPSSMALFDGYYQEPCYLKNDKFGLIKLDNFFLTPHLAYSTKESKERMNNLVVKNLVSFMKTGTPMYQV